MTPGSGARGTTPGRGRGQALLRPAVACACLLVVLLPALWVGSRLDQPPAPGELARVQRALSSDPAAAVADGEVARQYHRAAIADAAWPDTEAAQVSLLARARLGQAAALVALAGLCYLVVLLARGRLLALCSCLCLFALPSIRSDGHVLRPEMPASLFAALALLLWLSLAAEPKVAASGRPWRRVGMQFLLGLCAVLASGLCVAALPSAGEVLLVPGIVLTLAVLQLAVRVVRLWRRHGPLRLPVRALNRRLLPWTAAALGTPGAAWLVLSLSLVGPVEALSPTASTVGLLPDSPWRWPSLLLLLTGAVVGLFQVGVRFGRTGRVRADFVLWISAMVWLAGSLRAPTGEDQLPAALAAAVCISEGLLAAFVLGQALWRRGPR